MDGGVSSNDFVMQLTTDLFGRKVARPQHHEMSCLGAAFVAGLGAGMQAHIHTQHVCLAEGIFLNPNMSIFVYSSTVLAFWAGRIILTVAGLLG